MTSDESRITTEEAYEQMLQDVLSEEDQRLLDALQKMRRDQLRRMKRELYRCD